MVFIFFGVGCLLPTRFFLDAWTKRGRVRLGHFIRTSYFRSMVGILLGLIACASGAMPSGSSVFSKSVAVLDLVDLKDNRVKPSISEGLRQALNVRNFKVIPYNTMVKKVSEFGWVTGQPCNNTQCGFDLGGYLSSDFVLYGTYSSLENVSAVTLKLLYVPQGRIAWSWAGEVRVNEAKPDKDPAVAWQEPVQLLGEAASGGLLELAKSSEHRSLAIIDVSEKSYLSRIFSERVLTHVEGLKRYEALGPSELGELLSAMGINRFAITPSPQGMVGLGQQLGVTALVYANVYREGSSYLCRLAMYDIEHKTAVVEFPPMSAQDFGKILEYENEFFSKLFAWEKEQGKEDLRLQSAPSISADHRSNKVLWISIGLLGLGVVIAAFWVVSL